MCSDAYHNRHRNECAWLRAWAFGDGQPTAGLIRVRVEDCKSVYPPRVYAISRARGVFGAQNVALQKYIADSGHYAKPSTMKEANYFSRFRLTLP